MTQENQTTGKEPNYPQKQTSSQTFALSFWSNGLYTVHFSLFIIPGIYTVINLSESSKRRHFFTEEGREGEREKKREEKGLEKGGREEG